MSDLPVSIRTALPAEHKFLRETSIKVRQQQDGQRLTWAEAQRVYGPEVDAALADEAIVCVSDGVVLGFLLAHGDTLEMVYVKRAFRGEGIGLRLLQSTRPLTSRKPTRSYIRWRARMHMRAA